MIPINFYLCGFQHEITKGRTEKNFAGLAPASRNQNQHSADFVLVSIIVWVERDPGSHEPKNYCKCSSLQPYSRERFPHCNKVSPVVTVLLGFPRVQQLCSARERLPQQKCYSSACYAPQQKVVISLLHSNPVKKGYHPNLLQEIY